MSRDEETVKNVPIRIPRWQIVEVQLRKRADENKKFLANDMRLKLYNKIKNHQFQKQTRFKLKNK